MVGPAYDCLANPLGAVRLTFEKAMASGADLSSFDGKDWGVLDLFRHFLVDQAALSHVPILNPASSRWVLPNSLVRFRGMIQDMLGNEFYVGAYKDGLVWKTNKFMDAALMPESSPQFPLGSTPDVRIWERRLLYCVPVPGQNLWTESSSEPVVNKNWASGCREKRRRTADDAVDHMDMNNSDDELKSSPIKKMRDNGHSSTYSRSESSKIEATCSTESTLLDVDQDFLPCVVKVYDSPESELKLNDVFEFVGVLTYNSELAMDKDEFSNEVHEDLVVHMPPNKVPRLHCIIHRKLEVNDFLPSSPIIEPKPQLVKEMREALLRHLTVILGNDQLAAQFLLLHLLSKVHARVDSVAVGKLSLNLTCFSKESVSVFCTRLNHAVKSLLPFTHCIPLTLEYLNTASLAPKKDYQINRLIPGVLQLAEGSHLIIDETKLEAGTLNLIGLENARLLKSLMESQKVEYDFKYYKMEMATDVQMLILSDGKSNIMPADVILPFQPSSVDSSEFIASEALEACRWYLATVRSLPHAIEPKMQKVVENDLVAARQADRSLGSQDFSRWLTMGRLISVSFGETSLSLEHWQMVKELERLRKSRLS